MLRNSAKAFVVPKLFPAKWVWSLQQNSDILQWNVSCWSLLNLFQRGTNWKSEIKDTVITQVYPFLWALPPNLCLCFVEVCMCTHVKMCQSWLPLPSPGLTRCRSSQLRHGSRSYYLVLVLFESNWCYFQGFYYDHCDLLLCTSWASLPFLWLLPSLRSPYITCLYKVVLRSVTTYFVWGRAEIPKVYGPRSVLMLPMEENCSSCWVHKANWGAGLNKASSRDDCSVGSNMYRHQLPHWKSPMQNSKAVPQAFIPGKLTV